MSAARGKTRAAQPSLRSMASDPLAGIAHDPLIVPEWDNAEVIVRAPSLADRLFHIAAVRKVTGIKEGDSPAAVKRKLASASDHQYSAAALVVRVLYEVTSTGPRRVFGDADVDMVAAAYSEAHARVFVKAIELGNLGPGASDAAKKPLSKRPISASS